MTGAMQQAVRKSWHEGFLISREKQLTFGAAKELTQINRLSI
jgi:hypothetical protein